MRASEQRFLRTQYFAARDFADHQLLGETYWDNGRGARWLIGKPGTNIHRCEIIAGTMGSLVVHGDFDVARFAHYGDRGDAWRRLLWMADCCDVGYYVAQKASIGGGHDTVRRWDAEVAQDDLLRLAQEYAEEDGHDYSATIDTLREAADRHFENSHEMWQFLHDAEEHDLYEYRFGEYLAPHVIVSHVALNKCAWLLRARHGAAGPPACRPQPEPCSQVTS
jgi:hypothetical protein